MNSPDLFERILESLHQAALDPVHWPTSAGLIDRACGLKGNALAICSGAGRTPEEISFARFCLGGRRYEDLEREYFRDYWSRDERIPRIRNLRHGELVPTGDLYTDDEKDTSPTYSYWLRNTDMVQGLHVRMEGPDRSQIVWALGECTETRGWSSPQIDGIERLLPHVRHFASVQHMLADAQALGSSLAELLDNSRFGVIQLNRNGRILAANDRACGLLRAGDGLTDGNGFLRARTPVENVELQRLLASALSPLTVPAAAGTMTIRRRSAKVRLIVHINPVSTPDSMFRAPQIAALVLIVDPVSRARIDPGLVGAAMGLTPAESRLAVMLAAGHSLRDIASATGRTEGTVRWHLKQIFRKQGISRQTDLVRLVLSLDGLPDAHD